MSDIREPLGFARVDVDENEHLLGRLYFGSFEYDELDHWFYMIASNFGYHVPGSFEQSIVISICKSLDEEYRAIMHRHVRVVIEHGLPRYLKDDE